MDHPPGATKELHDGRYVLMDPLGQGSQGTTWHAIDKREGRPVAIKAFDVRGARAWKDVELAEREARVLSELRHPALPCYVEHFEEEGVLYLVMEKMEGTPLSVLQRRGESMREEDVFRLLRDADQVLAYLHGRSPPVIHRDLKPSNVIRRPDGSFAFVDFGAVRDRLRPEGGSTVVGTFGYMAPEQFQGRAGPASDVYAVGATALAMLTLKEPEKLPHRGLSLDVSAALGNRVSQHLRDVLARMVEPDPDKRPPRIGALLGASRASVPPRSRDDREAASKRGEARGDDAPWDPGSARQARRAERRARKRAYREARRAVRTALHGHSHHRPFHLPFPIRLAIVLALTIAQIIVAFAMQVAVPLVLSVLSIIFGRGLRIAAQSVRLAGGKVDETLADVRAQVRNDWEPETSSGVRVDSKTEASDEIRVRVATSPRANVKPLEEEDAYEDEAEESPRRGKARL